MSSGAFIDKLEASARVTVLPKNAKEVNVNAGIARVAQPERLYAFQTPTNFTFRGKPVVAGDAARRVRPRGKPADEQSALPPPPPAQPVSALDELLNENDERDVELLRMIQRASRRPKFNVDNARVAPDDTGIMRSLHTVEDAIAFFAANGDRTQVKHLLLNHAPLQLEFRPYDLLVTRPGHEEPEHYIMSATGIVHVRPNCPSDVKSLADFMRESSLFNVLRKIPFFKHYLLYKAFFRFYHTYRAHKFAATRKALSKDLLLSKATFAKPCVEILKTAHELTTVPLIAYEAQGKHDYFVDDFRALQVRQNQKAANMLNTTTERLEARLGKLIDVVQRRADVPNLNTREALEQYLLTSALSDDSAARSGGSVGGANNSHGIRDGRSQRKMKSMLDAKAEQLQKMRELKRSIVEYSKLDVFIRLCDLMASEKLFGNVLSTVQLFYNTLRSQSQKEVRTIGFQVLLQATATEMLFNPTEEVVTSACVEVFNGCLEVAAGTNRLCEQKALKAYFARTPKIWNIGSELKHDARLCFLRESVLQLIRQDYTQANGRMVTYATTLPHIHFLQQSWHEIEEGCKKEAGEEVLSCASLSKLYRRLQEAQDALRVLMTSFVGHTLWINAVKLKTEVEPRMHALREDMNATLRANTCAIIRSLNALFKQKVSTLNARPTTLHDFAEYVAEYKATLSEMPGIEANVAQAESLCELMDRQQVDFLDDEDKQLKERTLDNSGTNAMSLHNIFDEARIHAQEFIEENIAHHVEELEVEVANIGDECLSLEQILSGEEFVALSNETQSVLQYLAEIDTKLREIEESEVKLTRFGALFDLPAFDWSCIAQVRTLHNARQEIWSLLDQLNTRLDYWFECPVKSLNTIEMEEQVNHMVRRVGAVVRVVQEKEYGDEVTPHILSELQAIRQNMAIIHDCGNRHMTAEHWNIVLKAATGAAYSYHDGLNLHALQDRNVFEHKEVLAEQSGLATGEWKINNDLDVIRQVWDGIVFATKPYKNRDGVFILDGVEDIIQQLDDHHIELQTIMASRFVAPVRAKVEKWIHDLRLVSDVLEEWISLQKNWMYLEFIFASDDIKEQLPAESEQFNGVDRLFRALTSRANTTRNVLRICTEDGLLDDLRANNANIDHIQKKLEDYLETKRVAFPRFYFLSNDELLSILSDVRNPKAVQPHLSKCFDSIAALQFADEECTEIIGMTSGEGETVSFEGPVYPVGNVEQWLTEIEAMMKASLFMHMRNTLERYAQRVREEWFFAHPAQCIQAVDMIVWTGEVEEAIRGNELATYHARYQEQILRMVGLVKTALSKLQRALVCTLIVLDVHNRDIVQTLCDQHVDHLGDFSWVQQLRYYWEKDAAMAGVGMNVGIHHGNAQLWYGYEYLGNQPRLVITPLTDRAFLTCTSALGMNLGAAPQGPAGTGKTESVKDLGKALARQVVVFNCSDGISYKTMSRMFAGLAQAGAWACFDEFNRIELEVLSVVAQQMLEITTALGQHLERMVFDGHPIRLSKNFGVFITMNPGYAGRTELPDNLKALFRPICMMIPDYALIAEIMFYSEGFADARTLAQKMVQLYKLSSEQLSKQDHYDFGMRAVKSILVMAGALKRQHPNESEDMLLIRAMRDSNVPKFLREDTTLFMALVRDLFPAVVIEDNPSALLVQYLTRSMEQHGLQIVPGIVTKALQLYDTLVVRHGLMMVGQTLTGKTTILHTVQEALTAIKADGHDPDGHTPLYNTVDIHLLNPKSVSMGELYGQMNDITREWMDGILSNIARTITRLAQSKPDRQWIVFDGPVDAIWIENMNTVLDDNKLLCLFNGERIKLPATATFIFEVQDLKVASPATVSRCGMVFTEPYYLDGERGWRPVVQSLVDRKAKDNALLRRDRLLELLHALLPDALDFLRTNCREWIASVDVQLAVNCVELLDAMIRSSADDAAAAADEAGQRGRHEALWPSEAIEPIENSGAAAKAQDGPLANLSARASIASGRRESHIAAAAAAADYAPPEEFRKPAVTAATAKTPDEPRLFDLYFVMAFVWAIGGNLRDDARAAFSAYVKAQLRTMMPELPYMADEVSLYDYVVHRPSRSFITWTHLVPNFRFDRGLPYFDLIVPTAESVSLQTLLAVLTSAAQHVLVNGVTGTGKSIGLQTFLHERLRGDEPDSRWEYFTTVLSAQTRNKDLEERLESKLYKVRSNVLGPTPGKRAVFFIDDLNMPAVEKYGASPPLELLRQLITQKGFYDKHKSPALFKEIHDIVFLAACGVPGGGRNEMTPRLTSRFHLVCQPAVSAPSMRRIFGSILYGFLREWDSEEVCALAMRLVEATKVCYERIMAEKLPTPTRSHYTFNLRDYSKVIQGIMQASPRSAPTVDDLTRVFVHEVSRTFHDRLVDAQDRRWWWTTLSGVCQAQLATKWEPRYEELLFGDYMRRDRALYEEIGDYAQVHDAFMDYLNAYNMEYNTATQLVFFKDAIQHISRICRVLRQPRGHALLVGMGGTGRQSLCKLAAFICNLPIYEVAITRGFTMAAFRDVVKKVLLECGCHDKHGLFFLSDPQIVFEEMLEDVNNLLNSGEVPNLMQSEDIDQIVEAVRPYATAAGKPEIRHVIFSHFVSLCRDQVHIVLALSPVGEQFRRRLRTFPSLVNCCTIDWFDQWPADALASVAQRMLQSLPNVDDAMKARLTELCVFIHLDVQQRSEEFYEELHRRNFTTPTSYLELLTCYRGLLEEQERRVTEQIRRYQGGLDTLRSTQRMVDEMKAKLVEMQPKLIQAAQDTANIMAKVEEEQASAEVVRKRCAEEEAVASGIQAEADAIRADCQAELNKALPILKAAEDALAELRPDDIREVRSFQKPAARVVLVLEAVLTLLGEKDVSWDRAKLVMSRMEFIKDLQNYKRDELTEKLIRSIQKYVNNADFQPDEVAKSSKACKSLAMWVLAINNYYDVVKVVAPKRQRLAEAEAKVAVATHALHEAQGFLRDIEHKLELLQREMQENIAKKKQLEQDIDLTTVRLQRAEQLMSGLASEQTRWASTIDILTEEKGNHAGTVALAAGFIAYLGPFTSPYRDRMIREWYDKCLALEIPIGGKRFDLASIVDPVRIRGWAQQGLPPDLFSVQNGVIVSQSKRWCLCIDPQGQAVNWIRNMERENNLRVIKLSDPNYMRTLENAIRVGLPVLLENVEESIDAALDPVLLRQVYRSQGRVFIRVGDNEVDYDANFRLYMTTKLANPLYLPDLQIKVTIVNFTVTETGLENQLLADVVRFEYAELEQRADATVMEIANGKNELKQVEDRILQLLASSTGNILDNEQLVAALQGAKATSESVTAALRISEETQRDIELARNRYRPIATRGSTVYSVLSELSRLDHMYQNSLDFFKQLFLQTLQRTERADDVATRVALLLPAVTLSSYNTICRGLFEKDKLIFAFLLFAHIARQQGTIRDDEWAFLLKGSEGRRYVDEERDPAPVWLPMLPWNEVAALSKLIPELAEVKYDLYDHEADWEAWYGCEDAYAHYPAILDSQPLWRRLLVLKALREDLVSYGLSMLIANTLGEAFTESPAFDLDGGFLDSSPVSPIIFVLTPGTDPTSLFTEFAERRGFASRKFMLSLGQDQGPKAEEMIETARKEGMWVYLQNCHVYTSWMSSLERILEGLHQVEVHRDFRLWLTTMPVASFPVLLLQSGVKLVKEPPKGLKANIRDTFALEVTPELWNSCSRNATTWRRLLFSLTYFHAVIQERRRFGPLGWNIPYEWNHSDFAASLQSLMTYVGGAEEPVAWNALRYMVGTIHYGGRVTDFLDNRCLLTLLDKFYNDAVVVEGQYNITADGVYYIPADVGSLEALRDYLGQLPAIENPELFGLHANADITCNRSLVRNQLAAILSVQPRTRTAAGLSPEEKVLDIVTEFQRRLPPPIDKSKAHADTYKLTEAGVMNSLGTVAGQEIDVFNGIVRKLQRTLVQLQRGIKGEVVMSGEMEAMFDAMLLGQVPQVWHDGGYLSRKPLASWFEDTLQRVEFLRGWNDFGPPMSFWISGFFFPQGFLTGVLQTYSRRHTVPIDDVHFRTNLTRWELAEDIDDEAESGVYVHGLFLEGAGYAVQESCLTESRKGELYTKMPIIHLEPVRRSTMTPAEVAARAECYACPVYKTSARVGTLSTTGLSTNYVVSLDLPTGAASTPPTHWIERGVALLCMLDD